MKYRPLGRTPLNVSEICLGTMTWGERNSKEEAFSQIDMAIEHGINFIDTAEMYPSPPEAHTYSLTEQYLGEWIKKSGKRDQIILASKVVGPMPSSPYIREGQTKLDRENIIAALEGSLKRLKTDCLDLYQLHWPERKTNFFGKLGFEPSSKEFFTPLEETLEVLAEVQKQGKVKHFGVSNETPWGLMKYLELSLSKALPRMESIQNPYGLLNRTFEIGLSEISYREDCGLLAYSPLGFGTLTGKYLQTKPEMARLTRWPHYTRYSSPQATEAIKEYVKLAKDYNIAPAQLALQFVLSRPFVTSCIIGVTDLSQLKENIESIDIKFPQELLDRINQIHQRYPNPSP